MRRTVQWRLRHKDSINYAREFTRELTRFEVLLFEQRSGKIENLTHRLVLCMLYLRPSDEGCSSCIELQ